MPDALAESVQRATTYRMAYYFALWGGTNWSVVGNRVTPLAIIEVDGDLRHMVVDFTALWEGYPVPPPGIEERSGEMILEAYTDGDVSILRAPFAAPFNDLDLGVPLSPELLRLVDRWGIVRPDGSDNVLGVAGEILPGRPGGFLSTEGLYRLLSVASEVEDHQRLFVQGDLVNGAEGKVAFADLAASTGPAFEELLGAISLGLVDAVPEITDRLGRTARAEVRAALRDFRSELAVLPVRLTLAYDDEMNLRLMEVYVDATLPMRRLVSRTVVALGGDPDVDEVEAIMTSGELKVDLRVELYDFDSPDIEIVLPDTTDALEITGVPVGVPISG